MDSETILAAYKIPSNEINGQKYFWSMADDVLRKASYQKINPEFDKLAIVHWWMNVYVPNGTWEDETPYEAYHTWSRALSNNFKYIHSGTYSRETKQSFVDFRAYKKQPSEDHLKELEMWIPYIKPIGTHKYISIFEHSLSANGVYGMRIFDDKIVLSITTYGSETAVKVTETLKEMIEYIKEYRYYDDGHEDEEAYYDDNEEGFNKEYD